MFPQIAQRQYLTRMEILNKLLKVVKYDFAVLLCKACIMYPAIKHLYIFIPLLFGYRQLQTFQKTLRSFYIYLVCLLLHIISIASSNTFKKKNEMLGIKLSVTVTSLMELNNETIVFSAFYERYITIVLLVSGGWQARREPLTTMEWTAAMRVQLLLVLKRSFGFL